MVARTLLTALSRTEIFSMQFWHSASTVLGFRTVPTTVLLIVVYATIFSAVFVTDELPDVPKDQGGLNLDEAYADLHQVCLYMIQL